MVLDMTKTTGVKSKDTINPFLAEKVDAVVAADEAETAVLVPCTAAKRRRKMLMQEA